MLTWHDSEKRMRRYLYSDEDVYKIDWICRKLCIFPNFIKNNCLLDMIQRKGWGGIAEQSDLLVNIRMDFFSQRSILQNKGIIIYICCVKFMTGSFSTIVWSIIPHHILSYITLSLSLLTTLFINSSPTRSLSLTLSLTFFLF